MPKPYISITDFTTPEQVVEMYQLYKKLPNGITKSRLAVGVMMSHKTLNGISTTWSDSFPKNDKIKPIFSCQFPPELAETAPADIMNVLHFADYDGNPLLANLLQAKKHAGDNLHAIQLDIPFPDARDIIDFKSQYPEIKFIFQVNNLVMFHADHNPEKLMSYLEIYRTIVDYFLFDLSQGRGREINTHYLLPFINVTAQQFPEHGIAIAGGLGPNTLDLINPIAEKYPWVSIDAQSKLRPSGNALDPIDWSMAGEYLQKSIEYFTKIRS